MLTLHLIRHAKSSWDFPDVEDVDRPLNARGLRDAYAMAARWKAKNTLPDLFIASSASRAMATALIFARISGYPTNAIRIAHELYEAPEKNYRDLCASLPDRIKHVAIFGHNPTLTSLVNSLTEASLDNLPTTGIATILFNAPKWAVFDLSKGNLHALDFPKKETE
jgi:phosphohistidine phosphatase